MKNIITHIKAQRAARPRERNLSLDTRKVDDLVKGVEKMQLDQFSLENENRELKAKLMLLQELVQKK